MQVLGEPADGVNAVWYEAEGDHLDAALSAAGMAGSVAGGTPPPPGRRFVTTPRGTSFDVPADWVSPEALNGKDLVVQRSGAVGNADSIRIMEPTARYPNGYDVHDDDRGQPLTVLGEPGGRQDTHIPEEYVGRVEGWPR